MLFWVSCSLFAESTEVNQLIALLQSVQSMQAHFEQVIYDNHHKAIQKSFGTMALHRPGKFRWEVKKPIPQLIIANGKKLWIYDADLEQVTIRSLNSLASETPALLLSHINTNVEKDFNIQAKNQIGWQWFTLIPKQKDSMFATIELGFNNKEIKAMRLQDHLGHTTNIQFTANKTNTFVPGSLFIFKPSGKVDIIDDTR